jgi:hypothetical protein
VGGWDVDGAVISLVPASTSSQTLCAIDATAELLEDLQFSLGEGACGEAAVTGRPVLVVDLHHTTEVSRWPTFAAAVVEQSEVGGLFAVPLQWGTINPGVPGEGFHHRTQRVLHRNAGWGCPRPHAGMYLLQYVTSAATLATYVLAPRTSVTQTTSRIFLWVNRTQTTLTAGAYAPPALSPPSWRAAPCGSLYCVSGKEGVM